MRRSASAPRGWAAALLAALVALLGVGCSSPPVRTTNVAHEAALALNQRAARALQRGDNAQALALYEQALTAADSVEDFDTGGATLLNLAAVHARLGQSPQAHQRVDRILGAPGRFTGALQAQAAARKALLYLDAPDLAAALQWADKAEAGCAAPCAQSAALTGLRAHVALERGDAAAAAVLASRAATQAEAAQQRAEQANAQRLLGRAQMRLGDHAAAAASLQRALDIDRALGLPERIALDLLHAGENAQRSRQPATAREFYERALQVGEAAGLTRSAETARARLKALDAR